MALNMGPSGLRVGLRPVQMGPMTFVFILALMMATIVVLTINYRNTLTESAEMLDDLSKAQLKYKMCFDEIGRQKKAYARMKSSDEDTKQEMGDCVNQLKLLKDSEKLSIEKIEDYGRNISELLFEIKTLQRSIVLINENHQDLKREKERSEQICIQKKNQLLLRTEIQSDELRKREKMYQKSIESLEIKFKTLQRENQEMQKWKPQQEQNLKKLLDQLLLQQTWQEQRQQQHQGQQGQEMHKELIGNMQNLTQNENLQKQDIIRNQNHVQNKNYLRGQRHEFIQHRSDQSQRITHREIKTSMQNQQQQKKDEIHQIENQIQEKKGQSQKWSDGAWRNIDQNMLKKQQRSGLKQNIEKAKSLRPPNLTSSSLLRINIDHIPDHRNDGSESGRPVIQRISPGIQSAAALTNNHSEASIVNGQRGILTNIEGSRNHGNLVGNSAQQQVSRLVVRSGGSNYNSGILDSGSDDSEDDDATWDAEKALQKYWNAIRKNETEPVDYELEELDKPAHLDDYEKRK